MITQLNQYLGLMQGHHKLTISGVVFYVQECCHKSLKSHLNTFNNNLLDTSRVNEKIAEVLLEELKECDAEAITPEIVKHLINRTRNLRKPD